VTARDLAPIKTLIDQSVRLISRGAVGVYPKGREAAAELAEATRYWNLKHAIVASRTDPGASILVIHSAKHQQQDELSFKSIVTKAVGPFRACETMSDLAQTPSSDPPAAAVH